MPLAPPAADTVEAFYNGYTFNNTTKSNVRMTQIMDPSGRTVMFNKYLFTLRSHVFALSAGVGDTMDLEFETMRVRLQQSGGEFRYNGMGFGTGGFAVNAPGGAPRDAEWGPKPKLLTFETLGQNTFGGAAAKVEWQVEVTVPECMGLLGPKFAGQPVAFAYTLAVDQDASGYSKRTYDGQVIIPLTKVSVTSAAVPVTADQFYEAIFVLPPTGFKRESVSRKLSEDRRTLKFTFVDTQIGPNFPPPGVVLVEASHDTETISYNAMIRMCTISATYEVPINTARGWAYVKFRELVARRLQFGFDAAAKILPVREKLSEPEIYGRKCFRGSFTYRLIHHRAKIIEATGLWSPLHVGAAAATAAANLWASDMGAANVWAPRGLAGLEFGKADAIVDLCHAPTKPLSKGGIGRMGRDPEELRRTGEARIGRDAEGADRPDPLKPPTPDQSWVDYQLSLSVEIIDGSVEMKPLPQEPVVYDPTKNEDDTGFTYPYQKAPCSIVQTRTAPSIYVTLSGQAVRACYPINPPQLLSIGGVDVVPMNQAGRPAFQTQVSANFYYPICFARWRFRYLLPCPPTAPFAPLPNKLQGGLLPKLEPDKGGKGFFTAEDLDKPLLKTQ